MAVTGYRTAGVRVAVALVNAVTGRGGDPSAENLRRILAEHRFAADDLTRDQARALRRWGQELRPVFEAASAEEAGDRINELLTKTTVQPHISDHGLGLHLHYAPSGATLVSRLRAVTVMHLAELICTHGIARSGACSAPDCDRVYADDSRNAGKRYCSASCANRTNVARFRSRHGRGPARPTSRSAS